MFESICTVGERGQITLPKTIRNITGIKNKDKLIVKIENEKVIVEKLQNKKEKEKLMKEYYQKYSKQTLEVAQEWEHASTEADAIMNDY